MPLEACSAGREIDSGVCFGRKAVAIHGRPAIGESSYFSAAPGVVRGAVAQVSYAVLCCMTPCSARHLAVPQAV